MRRGTATADGAEGAHALTARSAREHTAAVRNVEFVKESVAARRQPPGLKSRATQTKPAKSRLGVQPEGLRLGSRRLEPPGQRQAVTQFFHKLVIPAIAP
jgi:hypothetical protein